MIKQYATIQNSKTIVLRAQAPISGQVLLNAAQAHVGKGAFGALTPNNCAGYSLVCNNYYAHSA